MITALFTSLLLDWLFLAFVASPHPSSIMFVKKLFMSFYCGFTKSQSETET